MSAGHKDGLRMELWGVDILDVLADAVGDTLALVPFLLVVYFLMEWLEHRAGGRTQAAVTKAGKAGFAIGALAGAVPQCGFSAVASTLYARRAITLGTLFAVYLSTSDEMLPIFIAEQVPLTTLFAVLGLKVVAGMAVGFGIDAFMGVRERGAAGAGATGAASVSAAHHHEDECEAQDGSLAAIGLNALKHTLSISLFIFLVSLVLTFVFELVGEEQLAALVNRNELASIAGASLIGLIPNCAASVALVELFLDGVLSSAAMFAGLLSAAGAGLLVLLRTNHHAGQNIAILCGLFICGIAGGLVISALGMTF